MHQTPPRLNQAEAVDPGEDYLAFLQSLSGPTEIQITGRDSSRCRAIVTLLHGNEPSGIKAIFRLLKEQIQPATDLMIIIASVDAALHPPLLSHRFLPWEDDLNRCFSPPYSTSQKQLARHILERLRSRPMEAIIDAHNTSGHSEPFAVAVTDSPRIRALSAMFANNLVVMDQQLGTLLEQGDGMHPWLTVEFGGFMDPVADRLAYESLGEFVTTETLYRHEQPHPQVLHHPLRLEVHNESRIHYSSSVVHDSHITIFNTIDQLNFQMVKPDTPLGWLSPDGLGQFSIRSHGGMEPVDAFFYNNSGFLTTTRTLTLFMATTDPYVARKDCLLYLTPHE